MLVHHLNKYKVLTGIYLVGPYDPHRLWLRSVLMFPSQVESLNRCEQRL